MSDLDWILRNLNNLKEKGLLLDTKTVESPIGPEIKVNGKKVLNFCSNNYLGFANHPRLRKAAKKAIDKYGIGPAAVRTIAGTTKLHIELEKTLAMFKKTEDAIIFQSGFNANIATIPALVCENDVIFSDELNHASIIDACRLSKAKVVRYNHCDFKDLDSKIEKLPLPLKEAPCKVLIVSDGVFSMDGDIAPLPSLVEIAKKFNAMLMIDDAHGEGVLGKNGRGIVDHYSLHGRVDVEIGTLSKAFGVVGGFAAGKKPIINWLRQCARPFLFSSAMSIADTAACLESVKILNKSDSSVKKLWENTKYFKSKIQTLGFDTGQSETPIIPIILGDVLLAKEFSEKLFEEKIFATAIGYPTVAEGKARIRIIISAAHTKNHLDRALKTFEKIGKELNII